MYKPKLPPVHHTEIFQKEQLYWSKQQNNFNKRHRAHQLKPLKRGYQVWIPEFHQQATILHELAPHPYLIQTPIAKGRNQQQFTFLSATETTSDKLRGHTAICTSRNYLRIITIARSGRVLKPQTD